MANWTSIALACVVSAGLCGGCASKKKGDEKVPLEPGVTDVGPATPASAVPPDPSYVYAPAGATQPNFVPVDAPAAVPVAIPASEAGVPAATPAILTQTPAAPAATPAPAGGARQYRVQKGDTLFRIAKTHYGNGNQWQQIASANPGLTPASLKAGATIVVP